MKYRCLSQSYLALQKSKRPSVSILNEFSLSSRSTVSKAVLRDDNVLA